MKQTQQLLCVASATLFFIAGTFMASAQIPSTMPTNLVKIPKLAYFN